MKKAVLGLALIAAAILGSRAEAATVYAIVSSTFTHDATEGTFVVSTSTYGAIVGAVYTVSAVDGAASCTVSASVEVPPRLSFPTANQTRNAIQQGVSGSGQKGFLDKCIAKQLAQAAILSSGVAQNVPGVDGATITP